MDRQRHREADSQPGLPGASGAGENPEGLLSQRPGSRERAGGIHCGAGYPRGPGDAGDFLRCGAADLAKAGEAVGGGVSGAGG